MSISRTKKRLIDKHRRLGTNKRIQKREELAKQINARNKYKAPSKKKLMQHWNNTHNTY